MAIHFEIKIKPQQQAKLTIESLLNENIAHGVYEEQFYLREGVIGDKTVLFDVRKIGRGVEVEFTPDSVFLDLPLPATKEDIALACETLEKILTLCGLREFFYDEMPWRLQDLENLKQRIVEEQQDVLQMLQDKIREGELRNLVILGAIHPIAFDTRKAHQEALQDLDKFSDLLHSIQDQDVYFARPMFLQGERGIIGIYILTDDVPSSFPLQPAYLIDHEEVDVSEWLVGFFDQESEDSLGFIPYDKLLASVEPGALLDAARFLVRLGKKDMKALIEKYGVDL